MNAVSSFGCENFVMWLLAFDKVFYLREELVEGVT